MKIKSVGLVIALNSLCIILFGHMGNVVNFLWLGKPRNINYCVFEMKFSLVTNYFHLVTF